MADPWRSGGSSSRSSPTPWRTSSSGSSAPVAKKKKRATPWGAIGNLWGDVQDAAVGIGTLPVLLGRQYVKEVRKRPYAALSPLTATKAAGTVLAKPMIESYRYQYGPLARGDVGEFGHRLYEHPLGPILDFATLVSGGAALAAKAGVVPAALGRGYVTMRTPSGAIIRKPLAKQTLRAELQVATNAGLNKLPSDLPKLGESARAGKALKKGPLRVARARELEAEPYLRTLGKVRNTNQRTATFWLTQVPLPEDFARLATIVKEEGSGLHSPKVAAAYAAPTPKMLAVAEEAGHVAEAQRAILGITEDVARQRAYMPTLFARGAKYERIEGERVFLPPPSGLEKVKRPRTIEEAEMRADELDVWVQAASKKLAPHLDIDVREVQHGQKGTRQARQGDVKRIRAQRQQVHPAILRDAYGGKSYHERVADLREAKLREKLEELAAKSPEDQVVRGALARFAELDYLRDAINQHKGGGIFEDIPEGGLPSLGDLTELKPAPGFASIDDMIRQIDADLEAAGRPKPVYMPHTSEAPRAMDIYGVGGKGPQRLPGPLHQTMGILLGKGQLIADPQVLRRSFTKAIKYRLYSDIHRLHVEHARPVDRLPQGWQFVRRKHSERIPYTAKTAPDFEDFSKSFLDEEGELTPRKPEIEFTTPNTAEAMRSNELPAVPDGHVRLYRGESEGHLSLKDQGLIPGDETHYFSSDRNLAKDYAEGGDLLYVDVPKEVASDYASGAGNYEIPGTIAAKAKRVDAEEAMTEVAGWSQRFLEAARRTAKAEKTPGRLMSREENLLWKSDWKAFSRKRGYSEAEISDLQKYLDLVEEGKTLGLSLDDIQAVEHYGVPLEGGRYLAVPTAFSNQLAGEFTRSGKVVYLMNKYPVRVWRHLVLKLRPAWLVNNILGNTLLALVHASDPVALKELAGTFKRMRPREADAIDSLMRQAFPEQVHGTFIGSQMPLYQGGKRAAMELERATSLLGGGIAQVDRIYEQGLRSSIVRAELLKSDKTLSFVGKMRKQTNEYWGAKAEELARNPLEVERISNRVNDALGDFMALGRIERDFVRSAFPFYAWFRVITGITVKLPLTHPVKAALWSRIGQSGATSVLEELGMPEEDVINGAKGFVGLRADEDGRIRGLATTSINPFATVADLQNSVVAMAMAGVYLSGVKQRPYGAPAPWESLPGVNPFIGLPLEALTGARGRGGINRYGLLAAVPQFKLMQQLTGRVYKGSPGHPTYYDQDALDALLRYFGIPYGRVSPQRIRELSERQR